MENEKGIVKLTRKQLYDEIWALSVAGVARKYNLNYGKLIATCKVENISFPSSGYWTKKNMGKDVSNEIVEFSGLEDTEISLITKDAVVKRIRKAKKFSYKNLSMEEIIHHLAFFVSRLWQIHVFGEEIGRAHV